MKYIIVIVAMALACPILNAQKLGHVNYGNLLESLPQIKAADARLTTFQDSLGNILANKQQALDKRVQESTLRYESGEMTQIEADQINASLNQDQQALIEAQRKAESDIINYRRAKLEPIIQRINAVIQAYGKEHGYDFIFDESTGFLLYDQPTEDLTDIIRKIVEE